MTVSPAGRFGLTALVLVGLLLGACSSDRSAKTTPLKFFIEADQVINPNERGEPSPVVLRIYELKSTSSFMQAQFFELLDNDAAKLGADLVGKHEIELKPGDKSELERNTSIDTKHVGIVAWFRVGPGAEWRRTTEITPERNNAVVVKVTAQAISIEKDSSRRWNIF